MSELDNLLQQLSQKLSDYKIKLNNLKNINAQIDLIGQEIEQLENEKYDQKIKTIEEELKKKHGIKELKEEKLKENIENLQTENMDLQKKTTNYKQHLEQKTTELKQLEDELNAVLSQLSSQKIEGKTFKQLLENRDISRNVNNLQVDGGDFSYIHSLLNALNGEISISRDDLKKWNLENPDILKNLREAVSKK